MNKEEYRELLKDGRWQRKRLEIMERDGFKCTKCGTTNDLNVHHIRYIDGHKPWEYDDTDLITLCSDCHKATHEEIERKRQSDEEYEEYAECLWRAERLTDLLLYYERIGEYHDVITMFDYQYIEEIDLRSYIVPFFYHDTILEIADIDDEAWQFGLWGFKFVTDSEGIKKVKEHIWRNEPDCVLNKKQFENIRRGMNFDREDDFWVNHIINYYFRRCEERYIEMEEEENARKEWIRKIEQEKLQRLANEPQRESAATPNIILPKISLSWNDIKNRH